MDFQPMRCSKRTFACPTLVGGHGAWVGVEFASQELGCQSLVKEIVRNTIPKASGSQIKFLRKKNRVQMKSISLGTRVESLQSTNRLPSTPTCG